jgi:hypothetical protein
MRPAERDRTLIVIEALCGGSVRLDGMLIADGLMIRPIDLLAAVAALASPAPFPAMTVELMSKALGHAVAARTYSSVALHMLLHWPRIQIMRDEADALEKMNREELRAEANARKAKEVSEQKAAARAERKAAASDEKRAA